MGIKTKPVQSRALGGVERESVELTDQTDRFLASLTLEGRYHLLIDAITDYAIYLLDPSGIVTTWNPGAERFKGYKADEIIGQHFSRFYTEDDRRSGLPARALETAKREGKFEAEGWRVRKDGSRFWAFVVIDPIRQPSGELIGFAKITRDLTERKEAQEKLEQAREFSLQSQKLEAIGQLTGGIAHDFNNLLMTVLGSLEMLRKRLPEDPRSMALLDNATQGAQRGATLTKRMLAFARSHELAQDVVHIPELLGGITDLLQRSVGPSFSIETRFPLALKPVEVDSNQLELALLNLILNARDAMPGGGAIIITAREEGVTGGHISGLKAGQYIHLSITDTGEGMDEETLRKAVEPFFTTKGVGKGTGLGLSMVHGFVEQSGGRFTLQSQKGKGTVAGLWLPVIKPSAQRAAAPAQAPQEEAPRSLTILAVDDDALVLMNTVAMLEDLGHTVFEAYSGQEALEILRREDGVDLVVTDQAMPKMTGTQLAKAVKNNWPDIPVLLATGYADMVPGEDVGLPKLAKPYLQRDLSDAIVRMKPPRRKPGAVIPLRGRSGATS
jgi:PAS domain S-box-containing protein